MSPAAHKKSAVRKLVVRVGDHVLMGGTRASYPGEWYMGSVVWIGSDEVLLHRDTLNGGNDWRQLCHIDEIRAVGTIADLVAIKRDASAGIRALQRKVSEAEHRLGAARERLFAKLEKLAARGLNVIPPDFPAMDREAKKRRRNWERADSEYKAQRKAALAADGVAP